MTMAENVIRKACDRCHAQKLSCKRINDEPCERCVRLKTECKSSPSLRYKKQQQLQLQHQQVQGQQTLSAPESTPSGRRSPKRRRTDSDPSLVPPEAVPIVPHTGDLTSKTHLAVTPDPSLDVVDFNFNFDQLGFFVPNQPEHLSHATLPSGIEELHSGGTFSGSWDPQLCSSTDAYPVVAPNHPLQADSHHIVPQVPLRRRSCAPEHSSFDKRAKPRTKQRSRQITLRQDTDTTPPLQPIEAPIIHWMAQLSDINSRLLDLASALPLAQEVAQNGSALGHHVNERFKGQGFPIDEMFKLTRRVADILEQPSVEGSDGSKSRHLKADSSDPGNSMLILSTYVRLLDMYEKVFSLVHTELSQTDSSATFRFWKLPDVTVGSFAVESSPFLRMSLTIQLAEEFLSRLRNSTNRWSNAGSKSSSSMFSGVVDDSFQAVKNQEEALAKYLVQLRSEIEAVLDA